MIKSSRRRSLMIILVAFAFGIFTDSSSANHSWGGFHWARTTPQFTLQLGDNLTTADWKSHLAQASSDWNSPQNAANQLWTGAQPLLTAVVAGQSGRRCRMVAGT